MKKRLHWAELWDWAQRGAMGSNRYMLVCSDGFSYEYYPVYVHQNKDAKGLRTAIAEHDGRNMQRVLEVYDLRDAKLAANIKGKSRVWQVPK